MRRLLLSLGALLLLLPHAAGAQTAQQPQRFDDWEVVRPDAGDASRACRLRQFLTYEGGGVAAEVNLLATDGGALLATRVATGVSFPSGIAYRYADSEAAPVALDWQFCSSTECVANRLLEAAEFELLLRRSSARFVWQRLASPVGAVDRPLSLIGLTRAWRALPACTDALQSQ